MERCGACHRRATHDYYVASDELARLRRLHARDLRGGVRRCHVGHGLGGSPVFGMPTALAVVHGAFTAAAIPTAYTLGWASVWYVSLSFAQLVPSPGPGTAST
jgi:hypothetical protein